MATNFKRDAAKVQAGNRARAAAAGRRRKVDTTLGIPPKSRPRPEPSTAVRGSQASVGLSRALGLPLPTLSRPTLKNPTPLVTPTGKAKPKKKAPTYKKPAATVAASRGTGSAPAVNDREPVSSPPTASNPSSGLATAAARRTAKQQKKTGGKSGGGGGGGSASGGGGGGQGASALTYGDDPITGLYTAANRDLERRQQLADATRLARLQDQQKFDQWVQQQRGSADQTLQAAFAKSAADAQAARQQSYDTINKYANEATRQANGIAGILEQAGANADKASFGFQTQGDAVSNAGGAFNQAAFAQLQNQQKDVDRARAANMVAGYNAQNFAAQQKLGDEATQLKLQEMKDRISQNNADRQFILDQQAAQFLQGVKQQELGIKEYAAKTDRIVGKLNAQQKAESNRIRAEIAAGTLDLRRADLQLKRKGYNLQKRKLILAESKQKTGNTNKLRQDASTFINKWNTDNLAAQGIPAAPRGDAGIAYARSAVGALKSRWPGLKATDAIDMLRSILPGDVMADNRILSAIAGSFR